MDEYSFFEALKRDWETRSTLFKTLWVISVSVSTYATLNVFFNIEGWIVGRLVEARERHEKKLAEKKEKMSGKR